MLYSEQPKTVYQFLRMIDAIKEDAVTTNQNKTYYNVPCSLDIETTSDIINGEKIGYMYLWQLGVNGYVIVGRTWKKLLLLLSIVSKRLNLYNKKRLIIYCHNLANEFQFIRKHLEFEKVFAVKNRTPLYAITTLGIEFRCSYLLTGRSLKNVAINLQNHKLTKLVGSLDYRKIRHYKTKITSEELRYSIRDVIIVMCDISERIERDGDISKIPLTKTGYVRKRVFNNCCRGGQYLYNRRLMDELQYSDYSEYLFTRSAFMGGFVHGSAYKIADNKTYKDVFSVDETSAYPFAMVAFGGYPMSKGAKYVGPEKGFFREAINKYACIFSITFTNIENKTIIDDVLSLSKCVIEGKSFVSNGRVNFAERLTTIVTELDFDIINKFYDYTDYKINILYTYQRGYLPKKLIESVLEFYEKKTTLKGVEGMEYEYLKNKEDNNSIYGCIVTDIIKDEQAYNGEEWQTIPTTIEEGEKKLQKYNKSKKRFLFYPWGIYVTAFNRWRVLSAIYKVGSDYIYSDTDSVKGLNYEKHKHIFEADNETAKAMLQRTCDFYKIPFEKTCPKTTDGVPKMLGAWDFEGVCDFKTLGAKRYMTCKNGKYSITVAGLGKVAIDYICEQGGFDYFNNDMYIPSVHTGKLTHTYIDEEQRYLCTDYNGKTAEVVAKCGIHFSDCDFSLKMSDDFVDYLQGLVNRI